MFKTVNRILEIISNKIFIYRNDRTKICENMRLEAIEYRYANDNDSDFVSKCIKAGANERHFKYLSKEEINKMIQTGRNMPNCILKIIKFNDIDVGFLYAGLNRMTSDKKRKNILLPLAATLFRVIL